MAEAPHGLLEPRDLLALGDELLLLALELELTRDGVGGVGAGPDTDAAAVELRDVVDALVEQVAVMGDHQDGAVEVVDQVLERVAPVHVQVGLGLVEQQQPGSPREARRERDELALAAAELTGRARERVIVEPERGQVAARLALGAVAAELFPAGEQALLVGERALHLAQVAGQGRVGEPLLGVCELAFERRQLRPCVEHGGERGALVALDDLRQ